ncbi:MAG: PEP-CTERM sorting domain-containing protein, partial [Verrucomicrobiia bacterium]
KYSRLLGRLMFVAWVTTILSQRRAKPLVQLPVPVTFILSQHGAGSYELNWFDDSFNYTDNDGIGSSSYVIIIVSSSLETLLSADFDPAHSSEWQSRSEAVTLPAGTYTITFTPQGTYGELDTLIDNVSVSSVPEPSTVVLAVLGIACIMFRRIRSTIWV